MHQGVKYSDHTRFMVTAMHLFFVLKAALHGSPHLTNQTTENSRKFQSASQSKMWMKQLARSFLQHLASAKIFTLPCYINRNRLSFPVNRLNTLYKAASSSTCFLPRPQPTSWSRSPGICACERQCPQTNTWHPSVCVLLRLHIKSTELLFFWNSSRRRDLEVQLESVSAVLLHKQKKQKL